MRARQTAVGGDVAALDRRGTRLPTSAVGAVSLRRRPRHRDVARHALLQQQFGRLHHRLGVEARRASRPSCSAFGDARRSHALVVRHVGAHDRDRRRPRATRAACSRAPRTSRSAPRAAGLGQAREDSRSAARGIDHRRQRRRIGRDHGVFAQAALAAEAGNAETGILIGLLEVARVVCGFRDAPGHAELVAVVDLPPHHQPVGLRPAGCPPARA